MLEMSRMVVGVFLGPGDETEWYGTSDDKPKVKWNAVAHKMIIIPIERGTQYSNVLIHWKSAQMSMWKRKLFTSMPIREVLSYR